MFRPSEAGTSMTPFNTWPDVGRAHSGPPLLLTASDIQLAVPQKQHADGVRVVGASGLRLAPFAGFRQRDKAPAPPNILAPLNHNPNAAIKDTYHNRPSVMSVAPRTRLPAPAAAMTAVATVAPACIAPPPNPPLFTGLNLKPLGKFRWPSDHHGPRISPMPPEMLWKHGQPPTGPDDRFSLGARRPTNRSRRNPNGQDCNPYGFL